MKNPPFRRRTITVAQRGQIIQRVIVDGWTCAAAAASFGVPTRLVEVWLADFRRNGMASLRSEPGKTIAGEVVQLMVSRPARAAVRKISIGLRRFFATDPLVQPLPLCRSNKDGPR
jgi:hypothetical protein